MSFARAEFKEKDKPVIEDKNTKELNRFEFWEVLVRIADSKYRGPKNPISYNAALEKLIEEDIIKNFVTAPWH